MHTYTYTHTYIFTDYREKTARKPSPDTKPVGLWSCLDFPFSSTMRNKRLVYPPPSVWCSISSPDQDSLFPSCALWKEVALHILHWSSGGLMLHLHEEEHLLKFSGNLYHFFQDMPMRIQCPPGAQCVCISLSFLLLHGWYPQFFLSVSCRIWHPLCSWC